MDVAALLRLHEGYRRHPYLCTAGKRTIGYGRNLDDVGIDKEEADFLLARDIERAREKLRLESYWIDLTEPRQAVLLDMVVNMGWSRFSGFQKMRAALARRDFRAAADEMVSSLWFNQVGQRGHRNVAIMRSGEWPA